MCNQYNGCWWPGDTRSQVISSHGIDQVLWEYFGCRWPKLKMYNSLELVTLYLCVQNIIKIIHVPSGDYPIMPIHPSPCTTHTALTPRGQPQRLEAHKSPHYGCSPDATNWIRVNTLGSEQNGQHFSDIFFMYFLEMLNENGSGLIQVSLKSAQVGPL